MLDIADGFDSTGSSFTIINNVDAGSSINGTFNGLAEGNTVMVGDQAFVITYAGGDGNDVLWGQTCSFSTMSLELDYLSFYE